MPIRAGSKIDATDFDMPDPVSGYANGDNVITATAFTDLPTLSCSVAITNPHPTANLLVQVHWGAWIQLSAATVFSRLCPRVSGSTTIAAGIGSVNAGPVGWGAIPGSNLIGLQQAMGMATYSLPVSGTAATFTMQAYKDSATGTCTHRFAFIQVTPLYYLF